MEEKILKIIRANIDTYQLVNDDDPIQITGTIEAAKEITKMLLPIMADCSSHFSDFVISEDDVYEWLKDNEL